MEVVKRFESSNKTHQLEIFWDIYLESPFHSMYADGIFDGITLYVEPNSFLSEASCATVMDFDTLEIPDNTAFIGINHTTLEGNKYKFYIALDKNKFTEPFEYLMCLKEQFKAWLNQECYGYALYDLTKEVTSKFPGSSKADFEIESVFGYYGNKEIDYIKETTCPKNQTWVEIPF